MSPIAEYPKYDFSVLRTLRKRESLTIEQVSKRSGVSAAVISRLERNQSSAELETLFKIARVFGMTATDLIAMAESPLAHITKEYERRSEGFRIRKVKYSNASCFYVSAEKGAKISKPEIHQDDYEICWVLEGKVRLELPHEHHELVSGESLQFDAIQAHTYEALESATLMITHVRKEKRF